MTARKRREPEEPPQPEKPEEDPFIKLVQDALETALKSSYEPKDANALFANCIKFLAVKHKISGAVDDSGEGLPI